METVDALFGTFGRYIYTSYVPAFVTAGVNRTDPAEPVVEIAGILNLSEKAIEYHLNRSLKELKVYLRNTLFFLLFFF